MSNQTAKSHKSRTTAKEPQPRQRTSPGTRRASSLPMTPPEGSSSLGLAKSATTTPEPPLSTIPDELVALVQAKLAADQPVPTELPAEKQAWYRKPDSETRKKAEKIAVMRLAGRRAVDIAKKLGISAGRVRVIEYLARKNGWYDDDDQPVDLEAELAYNTDRKIVRNINSSLDGQMTNWQTHEMTIAAARGRGVFKNHDKVQVESQQMTVVAIRVEMPAIGAGDQTISEENVGGTPAYLDAAVVEVPHVQSGRNGSSEGEGDTETVQRESQSL